MMDPTLVGGMTIWRYDDSKINTSKLYLLFNRFDRQKCHDAICILCLNKLCIFLGVRPGKQQQRFNWNSGVFTSLSKYAMSRNLSKKTYQGLH
jgi:hypothetical protein